MVYATLHHVHFVHSYCDSSSAMSRLVPNSIGALWLRLSLESPLRPLIRRPERQCEPLSNIPFLTPVPLRAAPSCSSRKASPTPKRAAVKLLELVGPSAEKGQQAREGGWDNGANPAPLSFRQPCATHASLLRPSYKLPGSMRTPSSAWAHEALVRGLHCRHHARHAI